MATIPPRGSKRLGRQVELDEDDNNRYVDAVFIASDLSQIRDTLGRACTLRVETQP